MLLKYQAAEEFSFLLYDVQNVHEYWAHRTITLEQKIESTAHAGFKRLQLEKVGLKLLLPHDAWIELNCFLPLVNVQLKEARKQEKAAKELHRHVRMHHENNALLKLSVATIRSYNQIQWDIIISYRSVSFHTLKCQWKCGLLSWLVNERSQCAIPPSEIKWEVRSANIEIYLGRRVHFIDESVEFSIKAFNADWPIFDEMKCKVNQFERKYATPFGVSVASEQ